MSESERRTASSSSGLALGSQQLLGVVEPDGMSSTRVTFRLLASIIVVRPWEFATAPGDAEWSPDLSASLDAHPFG